MPAGGGCPARGATTDQRCRRRCAPSRALRAPHRDTTSRAVEGHGQTHPIMAWNTCNWGARHARRQPATQLTPPPLSTPSHQRKNHQPMRWCSWPRRPDPPRELPIWLDDRPPKAVMRWMHPAHRVVHLDGGQRSGVRDWSAVTHQGRVGLATWHGPHSATAAVAWRAPRCGVVDGATASSKQTGNKSKNFSGLF